MEADFWHGLWEADQIGFHQAEINPFLQNHWNKLGLTGSESVLVPLAGKSRDMLWLTDAGHEVIGVELSQKALDDFLVENQLDAKPVKHDRFCGYELDNLTLLCGDFFHVTEADCADVKAVYDRAALVALPPQMRADYVAHLHKILPADAVMLLVVMEYDQSLLSGPPFSVSEEDVVAFYQDRFHIEKVQEDNAKHRGVDFVEKTFVLTPK